MNERPTAENDAPRCDCCDSRLVNGECPGHLLGEPPWECSSCVIPPGRTDA